VGEKVAEGRMRGLLREEVRGKREEVRGSREEVRGSREEVRGLTGETGMVNVEW
jgi:hypothetical protein